MKNTDFFEAINDIDNNILEKSDNAVVKKEKRKNNVWLKWGAIAACFCVIIAAAIVVPGMFKDEPLIPGPGVTGDPVKPYIPSGEPWSPVLDPSLKELSLTAQQFGDVFFAVKDNGATNQYTKVYANLPQYLNISPLPNAEHLPIYSAGKNGAMESSLRQFIEKHSTQVSDMFGVRINDPDIEEDEMWYGAPLYSAVVESDDMWIYFVSRQNELYLCNATKRSVGRIKLNGSYVSFLESDSDDQIKEKIGEPIQYVLNTFGKEYTNIKIQRQYSYDQLKTVTVYLYSPEETIFPEDFSQEPMTSEYISLTFYTDWGEGTYSHFGGTKDEAFLREIAFHETQSNPNEYYSVIGKAEMLSLDEAEELLSQGYVFGGHSCPLCMAAQPEVDFEEYTCVDIEYVSDEKGEMFVPFYAFYKYIGETSDRIGTYAKTYVPAVKVSGLDKYFNMQKENHKQGGNIQYEPLP